MKITKSFFLRALAFIKPWLLWVGLFAVLKFTGLGTEVTSTAQRMLLKAGLFSASPDEKHSDEAQEETFSYNFRVKDLNGKSFSMQDLKGKVVFLNLWATWCGPCRAEMPSIQSLYNDVDQEKIAFVMLSLDQDNQSRKIARYIAKQNYTFPVFQPATPLPESLRVTTIPTTFIISPDGKIKYKHVGLANYDTKEMREFLEKL